MNTQPMGISRSASAALAYTQSNDHSIVQTLTIPFIVC